MHFFVWKIYILWSYSANISQIWSTVFVQTNWVYFSLSDFDISGTAQILIRGDTFLWQGCQIIPSSNFPWLGLLPRSSSDTQIIKKAVFGRFKTGGNNFLQTTIFVQLSLAALWYCNDLGWVKTETLSNQYIFLCY